MLTAVLAVLLLLAIAHWKLHLSFAQINADLAALVAKFEAEFNKQPKP